MKKLLTPKDALAVIYEDIQENEALSIGVKTKVIDLINNVLDRTDLDDEPKKESFNLEGIKQAVTAFGPGLEKIKTDEDKAKDRENEFKKEIRDLWAGTFIAYTSATNSVSKETGLRWAALAVAEYKQLFKNDYL